MVSLNLIDYKKWYRDMSAMGYVIINNWLNSSLYRTTVIIKKKNEVFELKFLEEEIIKCIIEDLIEVCKADMESKDNTCNPKKVIAELVREGFL